MVIVGGITRLTQSGLSMVDWNLLMGAIPPMSPEAWDQVFEAYKQSPEFKIVNSSFTVDDFRSIFWWEYIHRMLGRLIGLVFVIPFVIFLIQKRISRQLLPKLLFLLFLGGFQGFLGWFMVKSGLVDNPHVSHFRLAAHLITAFLSFGYALWLALDLKYGSQSLTKSLSPWLRWTWILLLMQIIYGAFVAGLKAGQFYNTWPLMGGQVIPSEFWHSLGRDGASAMIHNVTAIQFIHRTVAFILAGAVVAMWWKYKSEKMYAFLALIVGVQFLLGVLTLVMQVPLLLGVLHQFGALALFAGFILTTHDHQHPITARGTS